MSQSKRETELLKITEVMADAALLPVQKAAGRVASAQRELALIEQRRRAMLATTSDPVMAASMLAQAERLRHLQVRQVAALAEARVALENARQDAAEAIGKHHALSKLLQKPRRR